MDIITLDSTNFVGLSSKYKDDKTVQFNQKTIPFEQNITFALNNIFKDINDNKINNYSNLFLTNKEPISSVIAIENLEELPDEGFSTYFALNAEASIRPSTQFWVVEEPDITVNIAQVTPDGEYSKMDNRYFFDVELLTEKLCKISHENDNITRYLTCDYTGNLSFAKEISSDVFGPRSPQIFYYIYDRAYNYMVLIKNINDVPKFITYNNTNNRLAFTDPLTGTNTPYAVNSVFRVRERNPAPNKTILNDPWVSYSRDLKTNTQDVNIDLSYDDINSNYLIHNEYYNLSSNSIDFNILSLKNINTPEYYNTRNNPFFNENLVEARDYQKLFTGTRQNLGNDTITLGYESYTNSIKLQKDKITYFHIPQVFYPFLRLNINDSGLVEAGAIAGDHPLKSDKIFKKKADYKYSSNFGDTAEENSGEFLCSWLSGASSGDVKPIWVDRYYNPSKISGYQALTATENLFISYTSLFDCLKAKAFNTFARDIAVFDKPSDLIFEKGTYYAYHHYGPKNIDDYIKIFNKNLITDTITNYKFFNQSDAAYYAASLEPDKISEFIFDGSTYGSTPSLSSIQESNQFTLMFDMYNANWQRPFGHQIVGNYDRDGFGVFNTNLITPSLFLPTLSGMYITNLNLELIDTLTFDSDLCGLIRLQGVNDFFGVFRDNSFRRYNLNYSETRRKYSTDIDIDFKYFKALDYTETEARVLVTTSANIRKVATLDLYEHTIIDITPNLGSGRYQYVVAADGNSFNRANSIIFTDDTMYFSVGTRMVRAKTNIFYNNAENDKIIFWENFATANTPTTAFIATTINDFNIDFDSNLWIVFDNNKFAKFTYERVFLLSGAFTDSEDKNFTNHKIDFTADFENGEYLPKAIITRQSYTGEKYNLQFISLDLDGQNITKNIFKKYLPTGNMHVAKCSIDTQNTALTSFYPTGIPAKTIMPDSLYTAVTTVSSSITDRFFIINNNTHNLSNSTFLTNYIKDRYASNNLNVKAQLTNIFNINQTQTAEIIFDLAKLDPGYHNFAVRFDADAGYMHLFIDGQLQDYVGFKPRKYKFSNIINRPFLVGTSSHAYSQPLFKYLKNNSFIASNIKIRNFFLYDKPLNDFDIIMHARRTMNIQDINLDIACGQRNYTEEIERVFKFTTPGSKSTKYNIVIKNTGITDKNLQYALEQRIIETVNSAAPVHTKLNEIKWTN